MHYPFQDKNDDLSSYAKNWGGVLAGGITLTLLGLIAICTSVFTTYLSVVFFGALFLVSGIFIIINTFQYWWSNWSTFFGHLMIGILYLVTGVMIVLSPVVAAINLTTLLVFFFICIGLYKIFYSVSFRLPSWKWSFFSGIISVILGILILMQLPFAGLYIIGLFVGIELICFGWSYVIRALAARKLVQSTK